MSGDVAADLESLLADHTHFGYGCACGWVSDDIAKTTRDDHRAHVAGLLAERVEAAKAEALREFHATWFVMGWPEAEDITTMHNDLIARIGGDSR